MSENKINDESLEDVVGGDAAITATMRDQFEIYCKEHGLNPIKTMQGLIYNTYVHKTKLADEIEALIHGYR